MFANTCYGANTMSAPVIYYSSTPVFHNETVLAATGNTDAGSMVSIAKISDTDPGSPLTPLSAFPALTPTTTIQRSSTAVKFLIPSNFSTGVYDFKIKNSGGMWSKDTLLNVPFIFFIQGNLGNTATPGGWLEVHGSTVGLPGGTAKLALVKNGTVVRYLITDPFDKKNDIYRQRFVVPSDIPAGNYTVYAHNGYGGQYGWVQFSTFVKTPITTVTISAKPAWPQTTVNVAAPTGQNDDAKIAKALTVVANGGIIKIPAGTYKLTRAIVLPNHVVLQGAGPSATILNWQSNPMSGSTYLPLVSGVSIATGARGTFSVKNLAIVATGTYNGNAIERVFTNEMEEISNISITLPFATGKNAIGIWLKNANNSIITDNHINARTAIFARDNVNNLRIERNWLQWREITINLSGNSTNFIITDNTFELLGNSTTNAWFNNDNPGFWYRTAYGFPYFSGAYIENLYYAHNKSTHQQALTTAADNAVGTTFDAGAGIYFGGVSKVQSVNGVTTVTLQGPTKIVKAPNGSSVSYNYAGAVMKIESGTGAGQWAYLTNALPNSTTVTIDHQFTVLPDSTSKVSIVNMLGRAIFDNNYFGADPTNQSYYFSMDVIKANNSYASASSHRKPYYGSIGGDLTWAGQHYGMPFTNWHFQFLNNIVTTGDTTFTSMTTSPAMPGLTGPATSYIVYRNNTVANGASTAVLLRSGGGVINDTIIEGNAIQYIGLGRTTDPFNFSGIVLRHNSGASYNYGNLIGKNPGAILGIAYLP